MWRKAIRCLQVAAIVTLSLALPSVTLAGDAETRPEWCRPGYVCVKSSEITDDAEYHLDLREQVLRYRSRASRFGLTIGFGLGVGGIVTEKYDVRWAPSGGLFVVWGFRP